MRTFFLFYIVNSFVRSPLLALAVVLLIVYLAEARYSGRYFNPAIFARRRSAIQELQQAVAENDHNVAAHNDLGRLLTDAGKNPIKPIDSMRNHFNKPCES